MRPHHERAIARLVEHFAADDTCLAVIIAGSVARGLAQDDSDIDVMLVVADDLYRRKWEENDLFYISGEFCDYPGGYVDGKIIDLAYLQAAAERGNEVTRAAFEGAYVAHSRIPGLEEIVRRIPVYQESERREKIQSFYAQFECAYWYLGEAFRRADPYLRARAASDLVLYGGRLVLAHNGILYPYHKHLLTALTAAAEKPPDLLPLIVALLEQPSEATAQAYYDAIKDFRFWNEAWERWQTRYHKDTELAWLTRRPYVGDD